MSVGTSVDQDAALDTDTSIDTLPDDTGTAAGSRDAGGKDAAPGEDTTTTTETTETDEPVEPSEPADSTTATRDTEPAAPSAPEWLTDDLKELASSYGIDDEELAAYGSPLAVRQVFRRMEQFLAAGGEAKAVAAPAKPVESAKPAESTATDESAADASDDDEIDLSKYDGYDPETLRVVRVAKQSREALRQLQEEMAAIKRARDEEATNTELERFHEAVDGMDKARYGGEDSLTDVTDAARKSLWEAYKTVKATALRTAKQDGRPAKLPPIKTLLRRAELFAFGDEILASERKALVTAIQEQAKKRRPVPGKPRPLASDAKDKNAKAPATPQAMAKDALSDPKLSALFDRYLEETGNAPQ